jgi:RNA polymerase sigma-70 factor (ECF subfamily)
VTDDATLLRRHLDGDADAFGELVRRHRDRLWAVALRTLGDPEEAADALQDALVNAFRHAGSFRGDSVVTTWLHRIVVNACLDRVRHAAARPVVPLSDQVDLPSRSPDPGSQAALRLDLEAALATLPGEQRVALVLVEVEGYPVGEVAKMLGCPVGTVKSRCARARARLLPLLTPEDESPPAHYLRDPAHGNPLTAADVPSSPASGAGGEPR